MGLDHITKMGLPLRGKRHSTSTCENENPKKRWRKAYETEASDGANQSKRHPSPANPGNSSACTRATNSTSAPNTDACLEYLPPKYATSRIGMVQPTSCSIYITSAPGAHTSQAFGSFGTQNTQMQSASSFPASSLPASSFPASSLAASTFPAASFPASTFPAASSFPAASFPASSFPASSLPASSASSLPAVSSTFSASSASSVDLPLDLSMSTGAKNKPILTQLAPMKMVPKAGEAKAVAQQSCPQSLPASKPSPTQSTSSGSPPGPRFLCQVCKEPATGMHYRVVTCEGCKGFWKRSIQTLKKHGLAEPKYVCKKGTKDCFVIGKENRKSCQYCRFQACLLAKMDTNNVMNSEQRNRHNEKKRQNRLNRLHKQRQSTLDEEQQIIANKVKEIYNDVTNEKLAVVQKMTLDNGCPLCQDVDFCFRFGRELLRKILPEKQYPKVTNELIEQKLREQGDRLVIAFILGSYKRVDDQSSEYTLRFSSQRYTEAQVDTLPEPQQKVCKPFYMAISHFKRCFQEFGETDENILVLAMAIVFLMAGAATCADTGEQNWPIISELDTLAALILTTLNDLTNNHKAKPVTAPIFRSYNCQATIPSCAQTWKEDEDNQDGYQAYKLCAEAVLRDLLAQTD